MKTPRYLESNLNQLLCFDLKKCHTDKVMFMNLYDHPKFNEIKFFKKTMIQHQNFSTHFEDRKGQFIYRLIMNEDKSEILGVVNIIIVDKYSYTMRYYFQMKVSKQAVSSWLSIVQEELVDITEQTNVNMIIEAVRLNFELPLDVKLNSQSKLDTLNTSNMQHVRNPNIEDLAYFFSI